MGNWSMHIRGIGPHHNSQPYDADAIFARTLDACREAGQNDVEGYLTYGGEVTEPQARSLHPEPTILEIAAEAYAAYSNTTDNKNFRGDEMPAFLDLPEAIQNAWQAAVIRARQV